MRVFAPQRGGHDRAHEQQMSPDREPLDFKREGGVWHDPISRRLRAVSTVLRKAAPSLTRLITLAFAYYFAAIFAGALAIIALDAERPFIGGALGVFTLFLIVKSKIHDVRAARRDPGPRQ